MHSCVVIGCGRVGTTLALALQKSGQQVLAGLARQLSSATSRQFASVTGTEVLELTSTGGRAAIAAADIIFITTPDRAVTEIAQTLSDEKMVHPGQIVAHTSGALGSSVLQSVQPLGALILSLHPLQSIASAKVGSKSLFGVYCTLEGDSLAVSIGWDLVMGWEGIPVHIEAAKKPQYHAAAVLASNAVVALAAVATELSGIEDGLAALLPLIRGAVNNLENMGLEGALTGPVERGDIVTVETHINALQHNPTALCVYASLGRATADLALAKGTLPKPTWQVFTDLFTLALANANRTFDAAQTGER